MITILTATFNRASTLPRLYQSLCAQTCMDFEWLVVDDGSLDQTQSLLSNYSNIAPFSIRIIRQLNSGKHVALNNGAQHAANSWVFIVDSDDAIVPTAIETIIEATFVGNGKVVGLCYRKAYFDMRLVGLNVSSVAFPITMLPTEAGHLFKGDLAYVFKTESLAKYKFPVFHGEKFVPELYIWNKIGDEGEIQFFGNTIIYLCDYLDDGYSKNFSSNLRKNPRGFFIFYWSQIRREQNLFYKAKYVIRSLQCYLYSILQGRS